MPGAPKVPLLTSRRMLSLRVLEETHARLEETAHSLGLNKSTVLDLAVHHLADSLDMSRLRTMGHEIEEAGNSRRPPDGVFGKPVVKPKREKSIKGD